MAGIDDCYTSAGGATGGGVAVVNTGHLQQLLGHGGGDDAGSSGGGDEPHPDGAALAGDLAGHGVGATNLVTPEAPPDGDDGELGEDDGATNGSGHLLGALHTETNMTVVVSNSDESLESCPLTGPGLLLDGHDLENLILESGTNEHVDNLVLFDGQRVQVDLLEGLNLAILDEPSQLGHGDPVLLFLAAATTAPAASTSTVTTSTTTSTATVTKTSSESSSITASGWSTVRHNCLSG